MSPLLLLLVLCLLFCGALLCLFLSLFFETSGFARFTGCVLWWDWLLLPEHLANSVKFSFCLAYSSNYLLATPISLSSKKILLCFCSLLQVICLLCTVMCMKSFRCGLFYHIFGFHKSLFAFHVSKSSLEERKKCEVIIQKCKNLVMNLKRSISVAII